MPEHTDTHRPSFTLPQGGWRRRAARRGLLAAIATLALAALSGSPALAAVTHPYEAELSKKATNGPVAGPGITRPGPASSVNAMASDGGHVWLGEGLQYMQGVSRVDEFDVTSGEYVGQLVEEGGVGALYEGLAIGHSTGEEHVYVGAGKESKYVVAVFGADKKLQATWDGAHTANGLFGVGNEEGVLDGIAVDNSANLETKGDVYVSTHGASAFKVVDVFAPEVGGREPSKVVGELRGTCKAPGVCSGGEVVPFREPSGVAVSGFNGDVLVADGNRDECLKGEGKCVVDVFEPVTGMPGVYSFLFEIAGTESGGPFKGLGPLAVNATNGDIYVADKQVNVVYEFDAAGKYIGRLLGTPTGPAGTLSPFKALQSVAADSLSGDVIVGDYDKEKEKGVVDVFQGDVVIPDVGVVEPPAGLSPHEAVLRGSVNPDGAGEAQCEFEYGTSIEYGQRVPCSAPVANGSKPVEVHSGEVSGLQPDTVYRYRLDASNANGTNTGECPLDCGVFTTPGPGVSGESATDVAASSATLNASVDPHGNPTSYYFQYSLGSTEGCDSAPGACTDTAVPPGIPLGSGTEAVSVVRHVQGLSPGTVYHYRLVAVSELQAGKLEAFAGADRTFTSQPLGSPVRLADERQWELVSPADKHGAVLESITASDVVQAAASGAAISYPATLPTEAGAPGYSELEQVLSTRGAGGWSSQDISLPHSSAVGSTVGNGNEYRLFSEDLSLAVVRPFGEFTSLAPCLTSPDSEWTPYVRHDNVSCAGTPGFYEPLLTAQDVPGGTEFGKEEDTEVRGASGDLTHVVISSRVALTAPPKAGESRPLALYEWSAGRTGREALALVSVLPDGKPAPGNAQLGSEGNRMARGAVSSDGSRVIWSETNGGHLYLRDVVGPHTLQLDVPQADCLSEKTCGSGNAEPVFQLATSDSSRVFFTDSQRLTVDAGEIPGQADLYECDVVEEAGVPGCQLSDVTAVGAGSGKGADVQGAVLGASSDGSQVYFAANGALSEGASKGGCHRSTSPVGATCNLYVVHRGASGWEAPKLVAVLGGEDWPSWGGASGGLGGLTARVSGNGRFVAFMSDRSLTGYDSRDASTGRPDQEVFVYDALAGRLVCASCDPTGARPVGVEYEKLAGGLAGLESPGLLWAFGQGIAASVPGWTSFALDNARYQSRYLSDEGRLFFDSSDALVPQDVNNNVDVYEWEPAGIGTCTDTATGFNAATGGCVGLVSSGAATGESGFVDASASGGDVFFLSGERLVGADVDTALDLYDAHECSTTVPCFNEASFPPPCTTAEACRAASTPQPAIFGAPASATFTGSGNVTANQTAPALKPKSLTRAQKLARALTACRKDKQRRKLTECERRARRQFAARQVHHDKTTKKGTR